jgi:hypothetical protein
MVWDGAYVLNHQVVYVTTDPILVSNLPPALELSATTQAPEARGEDENVGPRASIALDSGSSIHIFKDAFLLTDIQSDDKIMMFLIQTHLSILWIHMFIISIPLMILLA